MGFSATVSIMKKTPSIEDPPDSELIAIKYRRHSYFFIALITRSMPIECPVLSPGRSQDPPSPLGHYR